MNQVVPADRVTAIEQKINPQVSSAIAVGTGGITFQNAGEVMEYAKMMAVSGSAVPKHLRGQPGACLGIIDDAIRFQTSPYALARKSFFVNDNLAYEAQVIAGIINRFAPLKERPDVTFEGEGGERKCFVTFKFRDGAVRTYESPKFKDIYPKNSPLWKNDPDQQHAYYSLRAGARRFCPEIILGMFDVDEMRQTIDHQDDEQRPSLQDRLAAAKSGPQTGEGFDRQYVTDQTAGLVSGQEFEKQEPSESPSSDEVDVSPVDQGSGAADLQTAPTNSADEAEQSEAGEATGQVATEQPAPASDLTDVERNWLKTSGRMLWQATEVHGQDVLARQKKAVLELGIPEDVRQGARDRLTSIYNKCKLVCFDELAASDALPQIAMIAGCEPKDLA